MKEENTGDVWSFESNKQSIACDIVNSIYEHAINGSTGARNVIKNCFEDDWQIIKTRFNTEGSVWYVWYMDGVNTYIKKYGI